MQFGEPAYNDCELGLLSHPILQQPGLLERGLAADIHFEECSGLQIVQCLPVGSQIGE